jgi:DNA polymerase III sliding clamp (beta) subunit (PCNA family)
MIIRAIVPAADYLYLCRFTSTEQTRHYLNGVNVETGTTAGALMVATDGHRLGALRLGNDQGYFNAEEPNAGFILSANKDLQRACKGKKGENVVLICRDDKVDVVNLGRNVKAGGAELVGYNGAVECSFPASACYIDGTFPDWRRVFPQASSGTRELQQGGKTSHCGYNADYLADFAAAENNGVSFDGNGSSAAIIVNSDPRFVGLLMPFRNGFSPAAILERMQTVTGMAPIAEQSVAA